MLLINTEYLVVLLSIMEEKIRKLWIYIGKNFKQIDMKHKLQTQIYGKLKPCFTNYIKKDWNVINSNKCMIVKVFL